MKINEAFNISEQCDGRVKTLHPDIFSGVLDKKKVFFNLVAVNLYPFLEEHCIENIDIGGYSLIRASVKNYKLVTILTEPDKYINYIDHINYVNRYNCNSHYSINKYFAKRATQLLADDAIGVNNWLNNYK